MFFDEFNSLKNLFNCGSVFISFGLIEGRFWIIFPAGFTLGAAVFLPDSPNKH